MCNSDQRQGSKEEKKELISALDKYVDARVAAELGRSRFVGVDKNDAFIPLVDVPVGAAIYVDTKDFSMSPLLVIPDGKSFRAIPVPSNLTVIVGKE